MPLTLLFKKIPTLVLLNARIKCFLLKMSTYKLIFIFDKKVKNLNYRYSRSLSIKKFHDIARERRNNRRHVKNKLNIFWVGTHKDQDRSGFIQALRSIGLVNEFYDVNGEYGQYFSGKDGVSRSFSEVRSINDKSLIDQIDKLNDQNGVDILIGQMWSNTISKDALLKVQKNALIVNISMDDRLPEHWSTYHRIKLGAIGLAPSVDMVLTTSPETCKWYGVEGCLSLYFPLASDPNIFSSNANKDRDIDILFIGNRYGVRSEIIFYLEKRNIKVSCYGSGWDNGSVNVEEMARLSKRAKIILGIGVIGHCHDVYTLKLRDFDSLMTGALYITHRNYDLCNLYEEGKEIEYYDSFDELYKKLVYYLAHPLEADLVGEMGRKKALSRDTWEKRINTLFQDLNLINH